MIDQEYAWLEEAARCDESLVAVAEVTAVPVIVHDVDLLMWHMGYGD